MDKSSIQRSLSYEENTEERNRLAKIPYTDEWYRRIKRHIKDRSRENKILCTIVAADIKDLFERYTFRCFYCQQLDDPQHRLTVDKAVPSLGYVPGNIILACGRCNEIKGDNMTVEDMVLRRLDKSNFGRDKHGRRRFNLDL